MLDELINTSCEFDELKRDYGPVPAREMVQFDDVTAELVLPPDLMSTMSGESEVRMLPTDWAFKNQICQKLGVACWPGENKSLPGEYLLQCPSSMRARQLNHWVKRLPDNQNGTAKEWFVRGYDDGSTCRAVLSNRFSVVDVTETLGWVKQALDSKGNGLTPVIHNPIVTPDILHLRVLFKDVNDGGYAVGGYFTTGEIGNRRIGAYPLIQRHSCTNSIVIPKDEFSWEHNHTGSRAVLRSLFMGAIFEVLKGAAEGLDLLLRAEEQEIPDFADYIDSLAEEYSFTTETRDEILIGSEGHESLFGVVQGISHAANRMDDPTEAADMQLMAGAVLVTRSQQR